MSAEDLIRSLTELMLKTPTEERLSTFRGFKHSFSASDQNFLDAAFDLFASGFLSVQQDRSIVVALIHGIRTTAAWQEKVRSLFLKEQGLIVAPIGYGYFDVIRFLGWARAKPVERVKRDLRDLQRMYPDSDLVVMAHSFGTYIVSKILEDATDVRICRLLLCGSIIPTSYRWDRLSLEFTPQTLVNDVGTSDYWPVFARVVSWGYGGSGSFGFKNVRVWDRFFDYGHSDFFTSAHIEGFWKPFVLNGEVVNSPWDEQRPTCPWWISFLGGVPLVKVIVVTAAILISYLSYQLFDAVLGLLCWVHRWII